jgi:cell wall-associated NlpC family hydrolase
LRIARTAKLTAVAAIVGLLAVGSPMQAAATTVPARSLPADSGSPPVVVAASQLTQPRITVLPSSHPVYDVAPGDTLSQIAYVYCGRAAAFPALAAATGLADANRIFPGQRIVLNCAAKPAASSAGGSAPAKAAPAPQTSLAGGAAVVAWALTQVGKPYSWAAAGPNAYDCSGLVVAAYARLGIRLPHQSEELMGKGWAVSRSELRPGDVIQPFIGHVVIYVGNGRIVEAANSRLGVITRELYAFRQARRYV